MKPSNLVYFVIGILGAGAAVGYMLYSDTLSYGGSDKVVMNADGTATVTSGSIMPSSIEEKAVKADAVVIGTVKEVSDVFTRPDPNKPEEIKFSFRDATVSIERIVFGSDKISENGRSQDEIKVRALAQTLDSGVFTPGKSYLIMLRDECSNCIFGSDAFTVLGESDGRFFLEDGRAYNVKEGEMSESELIERIEHARQ